MKTKIILLLVALFLLTCIPEFTTTTPYAYSATGGNKKKTSSSKQPNPTVQCKGRTQKGDRCKRKTTSPNGYCYQHGGN